MRRIRKGDMVVITAGKDKGKKGRVLRVVLEKNAVVVEQANIIKKHQRPTQKNPSGGIVELEAPLNISNVMLLDGKTGKGTRFKVASDKNGNKVRVACKSGTVFE